MKAKIKEAFTSIEDEIRTMSQRAAMGLPETYVVPEAESLSNASIQLPGATLSDLAQIVECGQTKLETRLAAGLMLGLLGDPRVKTDDPVMCEIPGGNVSIGVPLDKVQTVVEEYRSFGIKTEWIEKEAPRHEVELKPFRIAKYPVTNAEFAAFLRETNCNEIPTSWSFGRFNPALSNHPVHTVSDQAAQEYAEWLSQRLERRFRLPTEAEWEYAASGPSGMEFPWGEFAEDCANTLESGLLMTTPVGCFPKGASPFGALDMAGNVEEWTLSFYRPYTGGRVVADDLAELAADHSRDGQYRVCRGGAFTRFRDLARCQRRHGPVGTDLYPISFRIVEDL